jgi:hypothetical protein
MAVKRVGWWAGDWAVSTGEQRVESMALSKVHEKECSSVGWKECDWAERKGQPRAAQWVLRPAQWWELTTAAMWEREAV